MEFKGSYYTRDGKTFYHYLMYPIDKLESLDLADEIIVSRNALHFVFKRNRDRPVVIRLTTRIFVHGEDPFETLRAFVKELLKVVDEKIKNGETFLGREIKPELTSLPTGEEVEAYVFSIE